MFLNANLIKMIHGWSYFTWRLLLIYYSKYKENEAILKI